MEGSGENTAVDFDRVFSDELDWIDKKRNRQPDAKADKEKPALERARQSQLFGLALSGGGIRSATFCLGVLQSLAKLGYLKDIDYLSTVSGGGYIGSWLTAWCRRNGSIEDVERQLAQKLNLKNDSGEADEIQFLREYSNYLTPRKGLLSIDTWALAATYFRNFINHFILVVLIFATLFTLPRVTGVVFHLAGQWWTFLVSALLLMVAIALISKNLDKLLTAHAPRKQRAGKVKTGKEVFLIAPMVYLSAWLMAAWLWQAREELSSWPIRWLLGIAVIYALAWPLGLLLLKIARDFKHLMKRSERKAFSLPSQSVATRAAIEFSPVIVTALFAGCLGGYLLLELGAWFNDWGPFLYPHDSAVRDPNRLNTEGSLAFVGAWNAATFGPVLVLLVAGLTIAVHIGMAGRAFSQEAHEWWSRLVASIARLMLAVAIISLLAIQGPWILSWIGDELKAAITAGWLATALGGIVTSRAATLTSGKPSLVTRLIVQITPYLVIVGLLLLFAWLVNAAFELLGPEARFSTVGAYWRELSLAMPRLGGLDGDKVLTGAEWVVAIGLGVITYLWSWRIGINRFSLSELYRARLVRCYLGASNKERNEATYTGFDPDDDAFALSELLQDPSQASAGNPGPYHIVNTTLNLTAGGKLAWQRRKGASFIMSPFYCGYHRTEETTTPNLSSHAYVRSDVFSGEIGGIRLGSAMAISGAAVSPAMGQYSTPAWTFLLSALNLRLGRWVGNPRNTTTCTRSGPRAGVFYLINELLGRTTDSRPYVYLSDGGHFENLGLYELVRRECRYIILCDAEHDPERKLSGLGNAIEKCRTDFGIDIDIDVEQLRPDPVSGLSAWHCAVGRICYSQKDAEAPDGILVYLKTSVTGDEPEDLTRYRAENPTFPHHTTGDQWFDETQFEAYRMLGEHIGTEVLDSVPLARDSASLEAYFVKLCERWYPPSTAARDGVSKHMKALSEILRTLRTSPDLTFLDAQFYPNSIGRLGVERGFQSDKAKYWLPANQKQLRAGFYLCKELITFMEGVFNDLHLEEEFDHPDSRGWMNLFSRWWWSRMFRFTWAVTKSAYGARFQTFCEQRLSFAEGSVKLGRSDSLPSFEIKPSDIADEDRRKSFWNGKEGHFGVNYFERQLIDQFVEKSQYACVVIPLCMEIAHDPAKDDTPFRFNFGFAILRQTDANSSPELVYYRVQSHLRKMGLGRRGLLALLREFPEMEIRIDPGLLPREGYEVTSSADPHRFLQLFESAEREKRQHRTGDA